jgi:hypothetical protein
LKPRANWPSSTPTTSAKARGPFEKSALRLFVVTEQRRADVTTQKVRVDGLDVAYTDTGHGPTVLFVHGVYVTGALWNDVVAELGDGFRCTAPTLEPRRPLGASCISWRPSI